MLRYAGPATNRRRHDIAPHCRGPHHRPLPRRGKAVFLPATKRRDNPRDDRDQLDQSSLCDYSDATGSTSDPAVVPMGDHRDGQPDFDSGNHFDAYPGMY